MATAIYFGQIKDGLMTDYNYIQHRREPQAQTSPSHELSHVEKPKNHILSNRSITTE